MGPGTTLGGRYTIQERLEQRSDTERWLALDQDLGRTVTLLVFPSADHRAPAILDAARVAAGVDQPTLTRLLDVGEDGPVAYVVEESLEGATSLAELVRTAGLPGDEVRRITGEVAQALESARQRGVHHLALTADEVFRTPEGTVKVRGLATSAARDGREDGGDAAAREDAVRVVALAYAGLTGLSPLAGQEGSLSPAPRLVQGVAAPSEIAAGVPRDLDTLCRLTFVDDQGPTSPGDYARQVAPWSSRPVVGRPTTPIASPAATADEASGAGDAPADDADTDPATTADAAGAPGAAAKAETAAIAVPAAATAATAAIAVRDDATREIPETATAKASTARPTAPIAPRPKPSPKPRPRPATATDLGPPAPLVPAEPLTKDESKLALSIVAAFVLLSLLVGLYGVSRIGSNSPIDFGSGTVATPSGSASPSASASPSSDVKKLAILSAEGYDPQGDQQESTNLAPRVFDGNPASAWTTEGYRTPEFGGLKNGVGLIVDLGPNVTAKRVELALPVAADVSVYVGGERSVDTSTKIGDKAAATGTVSFDVPANAQKGQYVIVWFTKVLNQDPDGFYRGQIGEVTVFG